MYDRDKVTGAFIVEIALHRYKDVFNEWDPAPFKRRDVNPDLYLFLSECSSGIPFKYPLAIRLHIPKDAKDEAKENLIVSGMKNYFAFDANLIEKEIKESNGKILRYVTTAIAFLFLAFWLKGMFGENIFSTVLLEGLFIGGWVFLWEAFSVFSFDRKKIVRSMKKTQRFIDSEIRFRYDE